MNDFGIPIELYKSGKISFNGIKFTKTMLGIFIEFNKLISEYTNMSKIDSSNIINLVIDNISEIITIEKTLSGQMSNLLQIGYTKAIKDVFNNYEDYLMVKKNDWEELDLINELDNVINDYNKLEYNIDSTIFTNFYENELVCRISLVFSKFISFFCEINIYKIEQIYKYYFLKNVVNEYCNNFDKYNLILSYNEIPFNKSVEKLLNWVNYRQYLKDQFIQKVPYDNFTLNDIYLPLCGFYLEKFEDSNNYSRIIINTEEWIINWINHKNNINNILLITGKPASGKTTLMKKLAYELASNMYNIIFIPIKDFNITNNLYQDIITFCERNLHHNPFKDLRTNENIIIIFDGLDEIALRGEKSLQLSRIFINNVKRNFESYNNIKIIITGRNIVIRENQNLFIGNDNILYVIDIMPLYIDEYDLENLYKSGNDLMFDRRPLWCQNFSSIRNKDYNIILDEIADKLICSYKTFIEITSEPFLLYLLAISYEDNKLNYDNEISVNKLYRYFINRIYNNTWNHKKRTSGAITYITEDQFYIFLTEVGLCSWVSSNRQIPIKAVEERCTSIGFDIILKQICNEVSIFEESITGLMLLFYIDKSTQTGEKAFEFSHKSFGEYFAGVKIAQLILNYTENKLSIKIFLDIFVNIFRNNYLDEYILDFIINELSILYDKDSDRIINLQNHLGKLFPLIIDYELYADDFEEKDIRKLFTSIKNVEISLFIIVCSLGSITHKRIDFKFKQLTRFSEWVNRDCKFLGIYPELEQNSDYSKHMKWLEFNKQCFPGIYLNRFVFEDCIFNDVDFDNSSLLYLEIYDCEFFKCDFSNINFSNCDFDNVIFDKCTFKGSMFYKNIIRQVKFINCIFNCVFKDLEISDSTFESGHANIFILNSKFNNSNIIDDANKIAINDEIECSFL